MKRILLLFAACLAMVQSASAHFVFVVPHAEGNKGDVVLSEDLNADAEVELLLTAKPTFYVQDAAGEHPLSLQKVDVDRCEVLIPGSGARVIRGLCDLGVMQRGGAKAFRLVYHPKTIVGDAFVALPTGKTPPVEIVPLRKSGQVKLQVLVGGQPSAGAEVNLVLPDGGLSKVVTDDEGCTPALGPSGRYGAWSRSVEAARGETGGKAYEEIRHYATLVVDIPASGA